MFKIIFFFYLMFNFLPLCFYLTTIILAVISTYIIIIVTSLFLFILYKFLKYRFTLDFLISLIELYQLYEILKKYFLTNVNLGVSEFIQIFTSLWGKFTKLFFFKYFYISFRFILNTLTKLNDTVKILSEKYIIIDFLFTSRYVIYILKFFTYIYRFFFDFNIKDINNITDLELKNASYVFTRVVSFFIYMFFFLHVFLCIYTNKLLLYEFFTDFGKCYLYMHYIDFSLWQAIYDFYLFLINRENYVYYTDVFLFLRSTFITYFAYIILFYEKIFLYWCDQIFKNKISSYIYESWVTDIWLKFLNVILPYNIPQNIVNFFKKIWFEYYYLFFFIIFIILVSFSYYFLIIDTYLMN